MAVSSHKTRTYVKATAGAPVDGDRLNAVGESGFNRSRVELETNYQGQEFASLILGRKSAEPSLSSDYDPADSKFSLLTLMETAHDDGTTLYITVDFDGTGANAKQVGVKVTAIEIQAPQDGKVSFTPTLRSCTAVTTVTIS